MGPTMEDDKYFTVEANGSKGWEVVWTSNDLEDATAELVHRITNHPTIQYRLTTPKV